MRALRDRAVQLRIAATMPKTPKTRPMDHVQDAIFSRLGGAIGQQIVKDRGLGSVVGRAISRDSRANSRMAMLTQRSRDALQLVDEAAGVLNGVRGVMTPRVFASLSSRLTKARSAVRPATVLIHSMAVIDGFLAYEPSDRGIAIPPEDYEILRRLETALRGHIRLKLSELTSAWWIQRVPDDVRKKADDRKVRRESMWPWSEGGQADLLGYLDFSDYLKIVSRKDNWRDVFLSTFKDEEILRAKLRELEAIRNDIAHVRTLTATQRTKLSLYSGELLGAIRKAS